MHLIKKIAKYLFQWLIPLVIMGLIIFYTDFKLQQLLSEPQRAWLATILLLILMLSWQFIYHRNVKLATVRWFRILAWCSGITMSVWTTFILLSIPFDMVDLVLRIIGIYPSFTIEHLVALGLLILAVVLSAFGIKYAMNAPKVKKVVIPFEQFPQNIKKLTIVHISDLHVGIFIQREYVAKMVQQINLLKPDLIVFTGDAADGMANVLAEHLKPLMNLSAPLGKFYVPGNHEYYWGIDQWLTQMRELGFVPLINDNQIINFHGHNFLIAGVPDFEAYKFVKTQHPDPQNAIQTNQHYELSILLSHNPRIYRKAKQAGFDLLLAGHTHSGQFFPFNLIVPLVHRYHYGLNYYKSMAIYTNPGSGSWGPPNRLGVSTEISLLILTVLHRDHI